MFLSQEMVVGGPMVYDLKTSTLRCPGQRWRHPSS